MNENISESRRIWVWSLSVILCGLAGTWWGIRTGRGLELLAGRELEPPCCAMMLFALLIQGLANLKRDRRYPMIYRILVWYSGIMVPVLIYGLGCTVLLDIIFLISRGVLPLTPDLNALIALPVSLAITIIGLIHARRIRVRKYTIQLEGLPADALPCRIVQLSDLHMGVVVGTRHLQRILRTTQALHPSYVMLTGDTFNHGFVEECRHPEKAAKAFRALNHAMLTTNADAHEDNDHRSPKRSHAKETGPGSKEPSRIFAVLGNHDPLPADPALQNFLKEGNITLLHDRTISLPQFFLAGRGGNHIHPRPALKEWLPSDPSEDANTSSTSSSRLRRKPLILLDHYPDGIYEAQALHVDLMLSGHTHGGQYFPCNLLIRRHYAHGKLLKGYSVWGSTQSIVSQGAGFFQIPIRVGTSSEVICIDLVPKK